MDNIGMKWKMTLCVAVAAAVLVGCGKKEEEPVAPVAPSVQPPAQSKPASPPPAKPAVPTPNLPKSGGFTAIPAPVPTGDEVQQATQLEAAYMANPDFTKRVETIYKISDLGTAAALTSLGRIFHTEKDPDLRIEVVDSLFDFDELDDRKVAILTAAAGADQPKEVRESAIDALGDLEPKFALPILQSLLSDPDEEIRDQAKDQIELLQAEQALQKP
ncbi:MAG: hypothetical protein PCFJNLEI_03690 [Verrucomicrobiae bacterium]|nr:hypothetical protein [Verrucomicrobiae bacterium]